MKDWRDEREREDGGRGSGRSWDYGWRHLCFPSHVLVVAESMDVL